MKKEMSVIDALVIALMLVGIATMVIEDQANLTVVILLTALTLKWGKPFLTKNK